MKLAERERVQASDYAALLAYVAMSVVRIRWVTFGRSCPVCNRLSGKVVGTQSAFLSPGDVLLGDDNETTLTTRRVLRHAPAHGGCDCSIAAEQ